MKAIQLPPSPPSLAPQLPIDQPHPRLSAPVLSWSHDKVSSPPDHLPFLPWLCSSSLSLSSSKEHKLEQDALCGGSTLELRPPWSGSLQPQASGRLDSTQLRNPSPQEPLIPCGATGLQGLLNQQEARGPAGNASSRLSSFVAN